MVTDSLSDPKPIINTFIEHLESLETYLSKAKTLASVMLSEEFIESTPKNLMYEYFGILCDILYEAEQHNESSLGHWLKLDKQFRHSNCSVYAAMQHDNNPCNYR